MNVSENNGRLLKSQRQRELDELRDKGLAKSGRGKLNDFGSPLTTPEQAQHFLAVMRTKTKEGGIEHKPPSNLSADGVDAWYMMQRHRDQEMKQRRKEAEALLRGYRMTYQADGDEFNMASPRARRGRASTGELSETLVDPAASSRHSDKRRQSSAPRLERNWETSSSPGSKRLFNEKEEDRGDRPSGRENFDDGNRALFMDDHSVVTFDSRPHVSYFKPNSSPQIDTSQSRNRLRWVEEEKKSDDASAVSYSMSHASGMVGNDSRRASFDSTKKPGMSQPRADPIAPETVWRDFISNEPGAKFPPEAGRYHLYASYACPGSHRALIVRALKGLEDIVSVTIVHPTWRHTNSKNKNDRHRGWVFGNADGRPFHNTNGRGGPFPAAYPGNEPDPMLNAFAVRELYEYANDTSGKYTIPLLWDKKTMTIVNNESSDIAYMLNSSFNEFSKDPELDLYTEDDEEGLHKLNEVSEWLYPMLIHGVYRTGFAKNQAAYDRAISELTDAFDMADELLQRQRYLTGDTLTDADIRLFVSLLRFDEVYAFYFRANTRLVMMTPSLLNFCREIYQLPGVAETCRMDHIKAHFYGSHAEWNKYSVIPRGLGFMRLLDMPHDRDRIGGYDDEEAGLGYYE